MTLPNPPLVEAILEIRWQLKTPAGVSAPVPGGLQALGSDPGYKILLGRLYDSVKDQYPLLLNLPASAVPEEMTPYVPRHQFRKTQNGWPLLQLGPGIFTVNETEAYSWATFAPIAKAAIQALANAYPTALTPFVPVLLVLRYVNVVPFDYANGALMPFLRDQFHIELKLPPKLVDTVSDVEKPGALSIQIMLPTKSGDGARLTLQTGGTDKGPGLVWNLEEIAQGANVPKTAKAMEEWLEKAHTLAETWFGAFADGPLMEGFKRGK